ncbi:MAG TPA: leucine--tRNA ligase [Niabella sp.]|nr:leucine--tRNA ligase [Niabella sp.]
MEYNFNEIEKKWQQKWVENKTYEVSNDSEKPKYYVLDMFPYPSGAGLHVGHPLGYIASDIYARYKRLKGFNVLHPMGYDAFGLPAEQYAIEHGIHPAVSTENNINTFRKQLDNIGFCFDWNREVRTSDPKYYKWTQWIFLQLFKSWFNRQTQKAEPIESLLKIFESEGNADHPVPNEKFHISGFSAEEWKHFDEATRQTILMEYRLAYCGYGEVNWCEALGTVLANDEVVNGVSERGGHPVVKKKLRQWYLRITEYADRLLKGLQEVDFSEAMKEMQTNWIGKSSGAEIDFEIKSEKITPHPQPHSEKETGDEALKLRVYTTRPDTIFGVDFMVIAPELELVNRIKSTGQTDEVDKYVAWVKSRSERERMSEKKISGVFTGAFAVNPFNGKEIPIWISEYVLAGYGTGAIMAVPCGDERDHKFAQYFNIPITNIIGEAYNGQEANPTKEAILENSGFINGMMMKDAIEVVINELEARGIGVRKTNYKMRDAAFSRQRYWGEPFPIVWKDGIAYSLDESVLPVELLQVESYKPGPEGEGPLANIPEWVAKELETNTMPGYAGSSWYFLRYMDPHNDNEFASRKATDYWNQVDLYIGGTEHAVGHLLYSRLWTKVLHDLGYLSFDEPYKRLVNQGMIQGSSRFVYRIHGTKNFVSLGQKNNYQVAPLHVDVNIVDGVELDIEKFKQWRNGEYADAEFILDDGKYICGSEVEKMSKSKFNTVNPDDLVEKYGADTFRMYEMFLGPVEISKPWNTKGIEGVHRFIKKLWRLFFDEQNGALWIEDNPNANELKSLHKAIKKIEEDTERFSFNTGVSTFMILVNELSDLKCHKKAILEPMLIMLAPYAPHIAEELWRQIGNTNSVLDASFPVYEEKYLIETSKEYPISVNGKLRTTMNISLEATQEEVEKLALGNEVVQKWIEGKTPKKIIYVKNKMVNVVV